MSDELQVTTTIDINLKVDKLILREFALMQINGALRSKNLPPVDSMDELDQYEVYVAVPGGGDWSSMDLTLLDKHIFCSSDSCLRIRAKVKY